MAAPTPRQDPAGAARMAGRPWVALVDKAGPHGRHGRAARARALAAALGRLGHDAVHFQALRGDQERTGLLGSAAAAVLGARRIVAALRDEARRRGRPPAAVVVANAQLARVARRARALGWTVWAELHLLEGAFGHAAPLGRLLHRAEGALVRAADRVVCLSPADAAQVPAAHGVPPGVVRVLPLTVEESWLAPPHPLPAAKRLLFVGSWQHAPNRESVRFLVDEVLPRLRTERAKGTDGAAWTLVLAGNGLPESLRAPGVEVLPDVPDMRGQVDAARVVLAPVWTGGGVRTKALEAMARSRPVVATATAMEGIAAADGKEFLLAGTPAEFVAAVQRLDADPALASRIGRQARRLVEATHSPAALEEGLRALLAESRSR